ncbi:hypothetical protein BDA99DRAFT_522526 [Phascolomyces articulosus]|uniref:Secreted protein n=1 Tax=Phascolomyces articulosus TaxID=60185 RepID=A0AAD5K4D7_9FUNG|nr:hypothetical protein BDA99DRAFT_522526 [Phascolomyces articulosus]
MAFVQTAKCSLLFFATPFTRACSHASTHETRQACVANRTFWFKFLPLWFSPFGAIPFWFNSLQVESFKGLVFLNPVVITGKGLQTSLIQVILVEPSTKSFWASPFGAINGRSAF